MPLPDSPLGQEPVSHECPTRGRRESASAEPRPRGGTTEASRAEIVPSRGEKPAEMDPRSAFQPLSDLPQDVPRRWRHHWLKLAGKATTSYRAAVELKCLECCAWQRTEARRCEIRGCPLWAVSRRIFGRSSGSEGRREQARPRDSGRGGETPRPAAEPDRGGSGSLRERAKREHPAPTAAPKDGDQPADATPKAMLFKTETTE